MYILQAYLVSILVLAAGLTHAFNANCYDRTTGQAKKCSPEFVNAAYLKQIDATNTCGSPRTQYCVQSTLHSYLYESTEYGGSRLPKKCDICDAMRANKAHSASFLTDYNSPSHLTWWQSETMHESIQYPNSVNLTLNLGKSFDITYIQIKFQSPRPESFAIYKRTNESSDWIPYQYYSASCQTTYSVENSLIVQRNNEAVPLCTDEFSDIAPLSGASVAFSTLEGRPSAYSFDSSEVLKEWVTATEIKIVLNRLNTFGDEIFNDEQVLKSYYYAISDIAVGARCKCNGHASECRQLTNGQFGCVCEHHTDGVDCDRCAPFYNDIPWEPATNTHAHECKPCECNGMSETCFFDQSLFELSGSGGHCTDCRLNTGGVHCETCLEGFYRPADYVGCIDCECNPLGSESLQCDPTGKCKCKPGVTGTKCDRCEDNHYDLTITGCKECECNLTGSYNNAAKCRSDDGQCECKFNVEGKNCDRCKPGFYDLQLSNPHGCLSCFCFGHSAQCTTSNNYALLQIESRNTVEAQWQLHSSNVNVNLKNVSYSADSDSVVVPYSAEFYRSENTVWLRLPNEFLGNKRLSYNQELKFQLRLSNDDRVIPSRKDIVLENSNENLEVYIPLTNAGSTNVNPKSTYQIYTFRLNPSAGWMPTLNRNQFNSLLSNLTSIKIRVNYGFSDTHVHAVELTSARLRTDQSEPQATFVENCTCPNGYKGQFCDQCQYGFKRDLTQKGDLNFARCIPCTCNNHSLSCEPNTGKCSCMHHTTGDNCEQCESGYYGNALTGTPNDCKKCPCPNNGPCAEFHNYQINQTEVVCLDCPQGTQGNLCEYCDDGYHKHKSVTSGHECKQCDCNGNIDINAIGNCDTNTGKCLRCVYNTTGEQCEKCLPGHWGNALTSLKCHACECLPIGTVDSSNLQCDLSNGQCECKQNVVGRQCQECTDGFWNLTSGTGCVECKCNLLGSYNTSCNVHTGQCHCRPGVVGVKCDKCAANHFEFSDVGCKSCNCDPMGSASAQCDEFGRCQCKPGVAGAKCNKCEENKFNFTAGCTNCDMCYTLVQTKVVKLRNQKGKIESVLNQNRNQIGSNGDSEESAQLEKKLNKVKDLIDGLHSQLYKDNQLRSTYNATIQLLNEEINAARAGLNETSKSFDKFSNEISETEQIFNKLNSLMNQVNAQLNVIKTMISHGTTKLQQLQEAYNSSEHNKHMQDIAKNAREEVDKYVELSTNADKLANQYMSDAHRVVHSLAQILENYNKTNENLIKHDYDGILKRTQALQADAIRLREALKANLSDVNLHIEKLANTKIAADLEVNANDDQDLRDHLKNINEQVAELNSTHRQLSERAIVQEQKILEQAKRAQDAIDKAKRDNDEADKLASSVQAAREMSEQALLDLDGTFQNATQILNVLENFEQTFEMSKLNYTNAAEHVPSINENIAKSNEYRENLKENLQTNPVPSIQNLTITPEKLSGLKQNANAFVEKANGLIQQANKLTETYQSMPNMKDLAERNRKLNDSHLNVKTRTEVVNNNAQKLENRIQDALTKLTLIENSIESYKLIVINSDDVKKLRDSYDRISLIIDPKLANEEKIYTDLVFANEQMLNRVGKAEHQMGLLREQVNQLEELNKLLDGSRCYSGVPHSDERRP